MLTATRRALLCCAALPLLAGSARSTAREVELPRRNPHSQVTQQVGLTRISVEYNSLAAGGGEVWGDRVALGRPWIEAETPATRVTFSRQVVIGDRPVPAGTYALVVVPGPEQWTVIFNRDSELMVTRRAHRTELDVARVQARVEPTEYRERLAFYFADFTNDEAFLDLEWERQRVAIPIRLETQAQIEAGLRELDNGWRPYADLAQFMLGTKRDYDTGLALVERSLALAETSRNLWIKAGLLAAKGRFGEARQMGERASQLAAQDAAPPADAADMRVALASWERSAPGGHARVADRAPPRLPRAARSPLRSVEKVTAPARPELFVEPDLPSSLIAVVDPRAAAAPPPAPAAATPPRRRRPEPDAPPPVVASPLAERPVIARKPALAADDAIKAGAPAQEAIARVIELGRADIRACYQRALRNDPGLTRGKVRVLVEVGRSGRATSISLDAPERLRAIEPCIERAVSRWAFPPSSADYETELPIVFQGRE